MKPSEQKALGLYQHLNGIELLAERQGKEKRSRLNGNPKFQSHMRCNFLYSMGRCENEVLPLSKFCLQRIFSRLILQIVHCFATLLSYFLSMSHVYFWLWNNIKRKTD